MAGKFRPVELGVLVWSLAKLEVNEPVLFATLEPYVLQRWAPVSLDYTLKVSVILNLLISDLLVQAEIARPGTRVLFPCKLS